MLKRMRNERKERKKIRARQAELDRLEKKELMR
jgi:hypothetical protein